MISSSMLIAGKLRARRDAPRAVGGARVHHARRVPAQAKFAECSRAAIVYLSPMGRSVDHSRCLASIPEIIMSNHVYKLTELTGSSPDSIEDAVRNAVARASKSIRNMRWFEVIETRGQIDNGAVAHWQVTIKIGFTLDDES
jgi:dodecin